MRKGLKLAIKNFISEQWILILVLGGWLFFQAPFLCLDLWNDEIYTLKHFTFVPFLQIVTDYHSTNNHFFFNLINHYYLQLIGEKNVFTLMDHPWVVRIVAFFYSAGAIVFIYEITRKMLGRFAAVLSIIFLCTTVPFVNFATQIRGYSLSMFLLCGLMYYLFSYIEKSQKSSTLFIISLLTALIVYVVPLNLYALSGVYVFLFLILVSDSKSRHVHLKLLVALTSGVLFSVLFYSPVLHQVVNNEVAQADPAFTTLKWFAMTKNVFTFFFSYRYWLLPFILAGLFLNIQLLPKRKDQVGFIFPFFLLIILTIPFLISLVRTDALIDRTFVNLTPFFAMLMAWGINGLTRLKSLKWFERRDESLITTSDSFPTLQLIFLLSVTIYCFTWLLYQQTKISSHLKNDIDTGLRSHNLYYNYYLCHFTPLNTVTTFKEKYFNEKEDFVAIHDAEPHDLPEYLDKVNIPVRDFSKVDSALNNGKKVFVFTRHPNEILSNAFTNEHHCNAQLISEKISWHNLFQLTPKNKTRRSACYY